MAAVLLGVAAGAAVELGVELCTAVDPGAGAAVGVMGTDAGAAEGVVEGAAVGAVDAGTVPETLIGLQSCVFFKIGAVELVAAGTELVVAFFGFHLLKIGAGPGGAGTVDFFSFFGFHLLKSGAGPGGAGTVDFVADCGELAAATAFAGLF